ncbi:OsmC family protein [Leucobacter sp. USHLN153]|uniref:OsmC family protein n=1 Tax=Leucobacter sp. USHLN153 TaxID=3081268 RepID=UPI00301853CC
MPDQAHSELQPAIFTAVARNRDGSTGESSVDGGIRVAVAAPTGPAVPGATNPEELLALAWATCLNAAARAIAGPGVAIEAVARVSLHPRAEGAYEFSAHAELSFAGVPMEEAESLAAAAHERCPVSRLLDGRGSEQPTVRAVPVA